MGAVARICIWKMGVLAWADVGVQGQTHKQNAQKLPAAVLVLWKHVQLKSAELCSTPTSSLEFLPPSLASLGQVAFVFPPLPKLLSQKEQKAASCFCFFTLRCWKLSIKRYGSPGLCALC